MRIINWAQAVDDLHTAVTHNLSDNSVGVDEKVLRQLANGLIDIYARTWQGTKDDGGFPKQVRKLHELDNLVSGDRVINYPAFEWKLVRKTPEQMLAQIRYLLKVILFKQDMRDFVIANDHLDVYPVYQTSTSVIIPSGNGPDREAM